MRLHKLDKISINFPFLINLLLVFFYTSQALSASDTVEDEVPITSTSLCGYVPRNYAMYSKKKRKMFR